MQFQVEYSKIKDSYKGYKPYFETHRESVESLFRHYLIQGKGSDFEAFLNEKHDDMEVIDEFKQKFIYSSTLCLFRSFDLLLSLITLDAKNFHTWSDVTAYYSKFYLIKAVNFLLQRGYIELKKDGKPLKDKNDSKFYFFLLEDGYKVFSQGTPEFNHLKSKGSGSHQTWWTVMESLRDINGIESFERVGFLLDKHWINPKTRNEINYSLEYLEGFRELEWFDSNLTNHHRFRRGDSRDFTSMNSYFANTSPEDCDIGDYYTDVKVILWESILCYLELYKDLIGTNQIFRIDNLFELLDIHGIKTLNSDVSSSVIQIISKLFEEELDPFAFDDPFR
ncbi:hypothetical protein QP794_24805 [Paenibacillus sp. UMB7766-LJ446]|uniref:hypothetical protein n=1 Tax=Paenibacillus sp. UMB7766-LJ446 TaxID=3046313 RepID=UPI00254FD101|nr:hypothetical protein [Paenibacillus sp. UMB7766-LJ446]MDK8193313.1 hypothetical protein [Paenibacillus sp. UMB7766-LJ446]